MREAAEDKESFSAAVTRLLELALASAESTRPPPWIAAGEGPSDLGRRAEHYLRDPVRTG